MDEQVDDSQSLPLSKAELINRIEASRAALEALLGRLSDEQVVAPGPYEGWSVKDHLAHLAAWEAGIAALLRKEPRYPAMGFGGQLEPILEEQQTLFRPEGMDADGLNAMIFERNKGRSLDEVRTQFRETQQSLLDALVPLDDADLRKTYSHYQPDEPGQDSGEPIMRWVADNTYEHYDEHQEWIEALVKS